MLWRHLADSWKKKDSKSFRKTSRTWPVVASQTITISNTWVIERLTARISVFLTFRSHQCTDCSTEILTYPTTTMQGNGSSLAGSVLLEHIQSEAFQNTVTQVHGPADIAHKCPGGVQRVMTQTSPDDGNAIKLFKDHKAMFLQEYRHRRCQHTSKYNVMPNHPWAREWFFDSLQ